MCYEFSDPAGAEIIKYHTQYMVIALIVFVQLLFWYRVFLGRRNGYEIKHSIWVNLFHPLKFDKPILTFKQKWLVRISGVLIFVIPSVYLWLIAFNTFCF